MGIGGDCLRIWPWFLFLEKIGEHVPAHKVQVMMSYSQLMTFAKLFALVAPTNSKVIGKPSTPPANLQTSWKPAHPLLLLLFHQHLNTTGSI